MRQTGRLFIMGMRQITRDGMLLVMLFVPLLAGLAFKLLVPLADNMIMEQLAFTLKPWYGLVDGGLLCLTPMMLGVLCAFLILEERDAGLCAFYWITPAGGTAYLSARIGLPVLCAFFITAAAGLLFGISGLSAVTILLTSFVSSLFAVAYALGIAAFAANRVEGLAVSKVAGLSLAGLLLPWFIPAPYQYIAALLPSFWVGKLIRGELGALPLVFGLLTCALWTALLAKRFLRRIQ